MSFEWDPEKSLCNRSKHGIALAEATTALEDELALTMRDPDSGPEDRFVTMAPTPGEERWSSCTPGVARGSG